MTVLVTGANGFVGVNIVQRLAQKGVTVIALARRPPDPETSRFLANEAERVVWVEGDVRDRAGLIGLAQQYQLEGIVHNAAMTPSARAVSAAMPRATTGSSKMTSAGGLVCKNVTLMGEAMPDFSNMQSLRSSSEMVASTAR